MEFSDVSDRFSDAVTHICKNLKTEVNGDELMVTFPFGYSKLGAPTLHHVTLVRDQELFEIEEVIYKIANFAISYAHDVDFERELMPDELERAISYNLCGISLDDFAQLIGGVIYEAVNG